MEEETPVWCDCSYIRDELENFCKEVLVLAKEGRIPEWKMFEQFLMDYIGNNAHDISILEKDDFEDEFAPSCSIKIFSLLAHKLDECRHHGVAFSTLLVDFVTLFDLYGCARYNVKCLWDFQRTTSFSRERETIRVINAIQGWSSGMELLLVFGLLSSLPDDSPHLIKELELSYRLFILRTEVGGFVEEDAKYIAEEAMKTIKDVFFQYNDRETHKRMFFVSIALCSIQLSLEKETECIRCAENILNCLRMYFAGTQDAFISVFEVRSVLYVFFKLMNKLHLFDLYSEEFERLMPDCSVKMEPPNLTQLVRCRIRHNLKESSLPLPSAVEKLFSPKLLLPMSLKSFLFGEVFDISGKKGNVSSQKPVTQSELESLLFERSAF